MLKQQIHRFALVAALVTNLGLMAPAIAFGQGAGPAGAGPDNALAPTGSWEHVNAGQSRWYAFTSEGKDKNDDPSHVLITLYSQPEGSAGFNIWSGERLFERAASKKPDEDAPPVGRGAKVELTDDEGEVTKVLFNHALVWAAGFDTRQTFYVEVYPTGSQGADYQLQITGDAVSFPTATAAPQRAPSVTAAKPAAAAAARAGGTGPDNALAPSSNTEHLNIGQSRWYAFTSEGKDKNDDPSHVLITLYTQPEGSAGFNIWSRERLDERAASKKPDEDAPPVGRGAKVELTDDEGEVTKVLFNHALVWTAGFDTRQTFYVEVYQTGPRAADYQLQITGDAVSFP